MLAVRSETANESQEARLDDRGPEGALHAEARKPTEGAELAPATAPPTEGEIEG